MYPHVTLRLLESFDRPNIRMHVSSRILWLPEVLRICPYDFCFQSSHSSQPLWHLSSYSRFSHIQVHSEVKKSKTNQFGESFPIYIFRLNSFLSPYEPDVPIILLLKNLSFLQKMEKLPQDSGLTSTFKRFSVPQAYLPNTTPYIPSGLEQPQRPPAQVSQMKP